MSTVQVRVKFTSGIYEYIFPHVQSIRDPIEGGKDTIIEGKRADGSIRIPGGKKSQIITIHGLILEDDYNDIMSEISDMRTNVVRDTGTLSLQHYDGSWISDWSYTVVRDGEIEFEDSLRFNDQFYSVRFLVLVYS